MKRSTVNIKYIEITTKKQTTKIKKITNQNRRDFTAIMVCEHCNTEEKGVSGYDDAYFHSKVIPKMECKTCGKTSGENYKPMDTKYPQHKIV